MNTLNKYIWSLSPLFRKLLIVLTKYVVYVLCLLLLIDYSEKLIAYYNNDFFEGMDGENPTMDERSTSSLRSSGSMKRQVVQV